jgi:hypothetical protein
VSDVWVRRRTPEPPERRTGRCPVLECPRTLVPNKRVRVCVVHPDEGDTRLWVCRACHLQSNRVSAPSQTRRIKVWPHAVVVGHALVFGVTVMLLRKCAPCPAVLITAGSRRRPCRPRQPPPAQGHVHGSCLSRRQRFCARRPCPDCASGDSLRCRCCARLDSRILRLAHNLAPQA